MRIATTRNTEYAQIGDNIWIWASTEIYCDDRKQSNGWISREAWRLGNNYKKSIHIPSSSVDFSERKRSRMAKFIQAMCSTKTFLTRKYLQIAYYFKREREK